MNPWRHDVRGPEPTWPVDVLHVPDGKTLELGDLSIKGPAYFYATGKERVVLSMLEGMDSLVYCCDGVFSDHRRCLAEWFPFDVVTYSGTGIMDAHAR
jgi:hypothetical protein